jgi:hypothetical protein
VVVVAVGAISQVQMVEQEEVKQEAAAALK